MSPVLSQLVAHGLATASRQAGGRRRTEYTITAAGRAALRAWLAEPGVQPSLEFEGLLKVLYADHGDQAALLATLGHIRDQALERAETGRLLAQEYLAGASPFPERSHVNAWPGSTSAATTR